jgi:hypothetical protein
MVSCVSIACECDCLLRSMQFPDDPWLVGINDRFVSCVSENMRLLSARMATQRHQRIQSAPWEPIVGFRLAGSPDDESTPIAPAVQAFRAAILVALTSEDDRWGYEFDFGPEGELRFRPSRPGNNRAGVTPTVLHVYNVVRNVLLYLSLSPPPT